MSHPIENSNQHLDLLVRCLEKEQTTSPKSWFDCDESHGSNQTITSKFENKHKNMVIFPKSRDENNRIQKWKFGNFLADIYAPVLCRCPQESTGHKTRGWHSIEPWLVNRDLYSMASDIIPIIIAGWYNLPYKTSHWGFAHCSRCIWTNWNTPPGKVGHAVWWNYCKVFENIWYAVIIYWDLSPQQAKFGNKTGGRYPPKALRDMYKTSYIDT